MGAKYHYSPPVQSTPTSNRHRSLHPSREPRANPSVTVRYEGEEIETETQQDDERWRKRGRGIYRARKEDGRGNAGKDESAREEERNVRRNARGGRDLTRVSAGRGGMRGTRARIHARVHTDGRTREKHTGESGAGSYPSGERAIRGMRPGLNYVPRNAFSRESHCERSV